MGIVRQQITLERWDIKIKDYYKVMIYSIAKILSVSLMVGCNTKLLTFFYKYRDKENKYWWLDKQIIFISALNVWGFYSVNKNIRKIGNI